MKLNYKQSVATSRGVALPKTPIPRPASTLGKGQQDLKLQDLAMLSLAPLVKVIRRWWLGRLERHYLMCADVEQQRVREAQANVAYYQKRAALARSARS